MQKAGIGLGTLRVVAVALLLALGAPGPAGADFVTYAGTADEGSSCNDPLGPPVPVVQGATSTVNLCFVNDDASPTFSDPMLVCEDGTGSEACSVLVEATAMGMTIEGFSSSGGVANQFSISQDGSTLRVIASDASGFSGRTFLGTITVRGTASAGMLDATTEWFGARLADGPSMAGPTVLATIGGSCGDGTRDDPPEQCDDGNSVAGDGCLACRTELLLRVSGTAQGGGIDLDFGSSSGPVVNVATASGELAADVVDSIVSAVNDDAGFTATGIVLVESPGFPQTIATSGDFEVTSLDPGLTFIPEPGAWLQLATALGALAALARLRRR